MENNTKKMENNTKKIWFTPIQAAQALNLTLTAIYKGVKSGAIPSRRILKNHILIPANFIVGQKNIRK